MKVIADHKDPRDKKVVKAFLARKGHEAQQAKPGEMVVKVKKEKGARKGLQDSMEKLVLRDPLGLLVWVFLVPQVTKVVEVQVVPRDPEACVAGLERMVKLVCWVLMALLVRMARMASMALMVRLASLVNLVTKVMLVTTSSQS